MVLGSSPVAVTIHVRFCIRIDISISIRPIITKLNHISIPSVYTHQIWQVDNLPWRAPVYKVTLLFNHVILQDHLTWKASIYKVTWPFDHVVLQDHLTWQIKLLCLHCQSAMVTKICTMVAYLVYLYRLLPIKSYEPLIMWSCKVMWNTKTSIFEPVEYLWSPNLAGW